MTDVIEGECQSLGLYLQKSSEPLLQEVHTKKWFSSEYKACVVTLHYDNWLK